MSLPPDDRRTLFEMAVSKVLSVDQQHGLVEGVRPMLIELHGLLHASPTGGPDWNGQRLGRALLRLFLRGVELSVDTPAAVQRVCDASPACEPLMYLAAELLTDLMLVREQFVEPLLREGAAATWTLEALVQEHFVRLATTYVGPGREAGSPALSMAPAMATDDGFLVRMGGPLGGPDADAAEVDRALGPAGARAGAREPHPAWLAFRGEAGAVRGDASGRLQVARAVAALRTLPHLPRLGPAQTPGGVPYRLVLAGGSVCAALDATSFGDYDVYIVLRAAATARDAAAVLAHVVDEYQTYVRACGEACNLVMYSSQAVTFMLRGRSVQFSTRVYAGVAELLLGYDLPFVCAAYDGERLFLTPAAVAAHLTRTAYVNPFTASTVYRAAWKYPQRGNLVVLPLTEDLARRLSAAVASPDGVDYGRWSVVAFYAQSRFPRRPSVLQRLWCGEADEYESEVTVSEAAEALESWLATPHVAREPPPRSALYPSLPEDDEGFRSCRVHIYHVRGVRASDKLDAAKVKFGAAAVERKLSWRAAAAGFYAV